MAQDGADWGVSGCAVGCEGGEVGAGGGEGKADLRRAKESRSHTRACLSLLPLSSRNSLG
jgi:hypothetical protein